MTEEEKQVIFKLREAVEYDKEHRLETIYDKKQIEFRNNIELMLNLIEELNYKINLNELDRDYVNENYIEKEKIRKEIVEQVNKMLEFGNCNAKQEFDECNYCKIILEKLLEEE